MSRRVISRCSDCAHYDGPFHTCLWTGHVMSQFLTIIPDTCPLPESREEQEEKYIRIIAVDFDGVLNKGRYPDASSPDWEIIGKVREEKERGSRIILWTSRDGKPLQDAVDACMSWGLSFDAVNDNVPEIVEIFGSNPRKITATEYWDDRAVRMGTDEDRD